MSHDIETNANNSGYGSSDETASLLVASNSPAPIIFGPNERLTSASRSLDLGSGGGGGPSPGKMSSINGPRTTTSASLKSASSNNNSQASSASLSSCGVSGSGTVVLSMGGATGPLAVTLTNPYSGGTKPILMRQDRTSTYLMTSPQLSQHMGTSEESNGMLEDDDLNRIRSVPDIELQCRLDTPIISVSRSSSGQNQTIVLPPPPFPSSSSSHHGSGNSMTTTQRCRACRSCERRASTTPVPSLQMTRSVSRESVRSISAHGYLSPGGGGGGRDSGAKTQLMVVTGSGSAQNQTHLTAIPPVFITTSPTGSRMIRQSSQPETNTPCCGGHTCTHPHNAAVAAQMRQLREAQSEGISNIVADSLRINGAMRPFKQVCGPEHPMDLNRMIILLIN